MLADIYIIAWTSYPSRKVRRMETVQQYGENADDIWCLAEDYNFNENDGVSTTAVFNDNPETTDQFRGNYLLVCDKQKKILSRWFVMRVERITLWNENQCRAWLRRDVVADMLQTALNASSFIEKGKITSNSNPLIWNKEDITLNRIKRSESLIKDETGIQWLVGYVPQDAFSDEDEASRTVECEVVSASSIPSSLRFASWADCPLSPYRNKTLSERSSADVSVFWRAHGANPYVVGSDLSVTSKVNLSGTGPDSSWAYSEDLAMPASASFNNAFNHLSPTPTKDQLDSFFSKKVSANVSASNAINLSIQEAGSTPVSASELEAVSAYEGKVIYIEDEQKAYRVSLIANGAKTARLSLTGSGGSYLNSSLAKPDAGSWNPASFSLSYSSSYLSVEETSLSKIKCVLTKASIRTHLKDAPYDMFAIPYADGKQIRYGTENYFVTGKAEAMALAIGIAKKLGSGTVYDVQELPYCPCREAISKVTPALSDPSVYGYEVDLTGMDANQAKIEGQTAPAAILVWCRESNFSLSVPVGGFNEISRIKVNSVWAPVISPQNTVDSATKKALGGWWGKKPIQNKVENQTQTFRLSSPNMSGAFEFSASANQGVSSFRVDCTYRPFNPYIHVAIDFKGLYGSDFGDARGLVCGGDFSVSQLTSAWADYQLNNKNYQAVFDRQITNMEVSQKYQRVGDIVSGISGTLSAGTQGASVGALAGGPVGAIAGAASGTLASGVGAIADWNINEALRKEAIDYRKDLFGYSLGNIQAIPYGLSKTSAINANNKRFPFLERYSCTDVEEMALRAKIEADGMSIGVIGQISEYAPADGGWNYVKAQLIRAQDDHSLTANQLTALTEELYKGIYLRRGS